VTQDDWTRWCDAHPWISGTMQLGIYALCWAGFFIAFGIVILFLHLLSLVF